MEKDKKQPDINISIDGPTAQGIYSNIAITSHSSSEFVIDFASILPGINKAEVRSRIIMTPENAKNLLMSLQDNIAKYEANVRTIGNTKSTMPLNFDDLPHIVS